MNVGDIVRVRLKKSPEIPRVGVLIRMPRKMYMSPGKIAEVMIDGEIQYVKSDHVEVVKARTET